MADLQRFIVAQQNIYPQALEQLHAGSKTGHWMWFIFPQIRGLGSSPTSQEYAIASLAEASAYLTDPTLGKRLRACCEALLAMQNLTAQAIFGDVDAMKLRSSMTLFAAAAPDDTLFKDVLQKYFAGEPDDRTLHILQKQAPL